MEAKQNLLRHRLLLMVLLLLGTFMTACNDDDINLDDLMKNDKSFEGVKLLGANEVPAVDSDGYGLMNAQYNSKTKMLSYDLVWTLGDATDTTVGMHFHGPATPNMNAGVKRAVTGFSSDAGGTLSGSVGPLTDEEEEQLLNGLWYFNIHSSKYPSGELRGNLLP